MSKTGITETQVAEAADQLLANGSDVSARAIRQALGTGSMTTVIKHLRVWRNARHTDGTAPTELPRPVRDAALRALHEVWCTANREAREAIEQIRMAAGKRGDDLERDLDEALSASQELEEKLGDRTAELATIQERTAALERELFTKELEVRMLRERLEAAAREADQRCAALTLERITAALDQGRSTNTPEKS